MRSFVILVCSPLAATLLFWTLFVACIDPSSTGAGVDPPPVARLEATWDPLICGDPHRVVVELEDDNGAKLSSSTPCTIGGLTIGVEHFGVYRGRIYSWVLDGPIRSITPVDITVDQPIVHWVVPTPP